MVTKQAYSFRTRMLALIMIAVFVSGCASLKLNSSDKNSERIEAEDADYKGAIFDKIHYGYSGSGFIDYQNKFGDYIQWTVYAHSEGEHSIAFRYALGANEDRPLKITVNEKIIKSSLSFPPTGSWNIWNTVGITATLKKGYNKIKATAIGKSGANIDCIIVLK